MRARHGTCLNNGVRRVKLSGAIDLVLTCGVLCVGCVGGDAPKDPFAVGDAAPSGGKMSTGDAGTPNVSVKAGSKDSHYPLSNGATWTYHHENPTKEPWDEMDTLVGTTYNGKPAFVLNDQEDAQGEQTASTLIVDGTGVYRVYKEVRVNDQLALKVTYDPAFLRYDEAWTTEGFTQTLDDDWKQECVFTSSASKCAAGAIKPGTTTHVFTVVSTSEEVTVPAGTFKTVLIERNNPLDRETKRFWFAKGVGKVRELDLQSNATEELTAYDIP
jgi:hypothetical protein